jgi:hypothetical protein
MLNYNTFKDSKSFRFASKTGFIFARAIWYLSSVTFANTSDRFLLIG